MYISKDKKLFFTIPNKVKANSGEFYDIQDYLGKGGNSTVYECFDNAGNEYAIKFQLNLDKKSKKRFLQEVKLLKKLNHPHLIKYINDGEIEANKQINKKKKKGKTKTKCKIPFVIMEKAETNLLNYLNEHKNILYSEYIGQFLGLSDALSKLHEIAIHRDLKLENILVIGDRWVISDFGLCSFLGKEHKDITQINEKVGPKYWMSPEAINKKYDSTIDIVPASDVFQLSAIFWFVVTSKYPLGIVSTNDWNADDLNLGNVLINGLLHNTSKRIQNGSEMFSKLSEVVDSNRRKKSMFFKFYEYLSNFSKSLYFDFMKFFSK